MYLVNNHVFKGRTIKFPLKKLYILRWIDGFHHYVVSDKYSNQSCSG